MACLTHTHTHTHTHTRQWHSLRKVREYESAFLGQQLVLLHAELLQQLPPCHCEYGLEQAAAKHLSGLVARQAVVALGDVAVA